MTSSQILPPLVQAEAEELCAHVRASHEGRWLSPARWQCLGCLAMAQGDPGRRCMADRLDWRGCPLVNREEMRRRLA